MSVICKKVFLKLNLKKQEISQNFILTSAANFEGNEKFVLNCRTKVRSLIWYLQQKIDCNLLMDYESFRLSHSLVGEYLKRSMTWLQIVSFMKITLHSISPSVLKANSRVIKVVVPTRKLVSRNVLLEFQSTSEIRRTESYAANSDGGEGGPGNSWLRRTLIFVGPGKLWIYGSVALSVFTCRDALPSA